MGLTAHFYKSKKRGVYRKSDKNNEIAYFRNNFPLQRHLGYGDSVVLLDKEQLKEIKYLAEEDEDFNKDYGEGESVVSGTSKALEAVKEGYLVYYHASF